MPSRRQFLAAAAASAAATLAGCTGSDDGGDDTETPRDSPTSTTPAPTTTAPTTSPRTTVRVPDSVASHDFSWDSGSIDHDPEGDPVVSFEDDRVVVEGALQYGSSSCNRIFLDDLSYADGELSVRVAAGQKPDAGPECTDDISAGDYRVTATMDDDLPARVAVTEVDWQGNERNHTATRD